MLRRAANEAGVTMVEGTLGICLLIFAALFAIQFVLFFHGTLAAKAAASVGARRLALTGDPLAARASLEQQQRTALRSLTWHPAQCQYGRPVAVCRVTVQIPSLLPAGGALFGSGGAFGPILVEEAGQYPTEGAGG